MARYLMQGAVVRGMSRMGTALAGVCASMALLLAGCGVGGRTASPTSPSGPASPTTPHVIATLPVRLGRAVDPAQNRLYVADDNDRLDVFDGATYRLITSMAMSTEPDSIAVNSSTNRIYVASQAACMVTVIDGASDSVVSTVQVGSQPESVVVNAAANRIYVANAGDKTVSVIDGSRDSVVNTVPIGSAPNSMAVNETYVITSPFVLRKLIWSRERRKSDFRAPAVTLPVVCRARYEPTFTGNQLQRNYEPNICAEPGRWHRERHRWQPLFQRWAMEYPERITLHHWPQYGGQMVLGLTTGRPDAPFRLVTAVPHAHEPAQTAATVDFAAHLVTGRRLDGSPPEIDLCPILRYFSFSASSKRTFVGICWRYLRSSLDNAWLLR